MVLIICVIQLYIYIQLFIQVHVVSFGSFWKVHVGHYGANKYVTSPWW